MATKNNPGAYDCHANAHPDEPMFVLLGRDPTAPSLVMMWCALRLAMGGTDDAQIAEAEACSKAMERWALSLGKADKINAARRSMILAVRQLAAELEMASAKAEPVAAWHETAPDAAPPKVPAAERRSVSLEPDRSQVLLPPHREKPIRIMRFQIAGSGSDRGIPSMLDRAQVVLALDGTSMGAWRATVGGVFEVDDESLAGVVIDPFQKLTVALVRARSGPTLPVTVTLDWEEV